jgi:hypothetical protein
MAKLCPVRFLITWLVVLGLPWMKLGKPLEWLGLPMTYQFNSRSEGNTESFSGGGRWRAKIKGKRMNFAFLLHPFTFFMYLMLISY